MTDRIIDYPTVAERTAAYKVFMKALRTGELVRAASCAWCGSDTGTMHGHHPDYARPLMVVWLCRTCHFAHHRKYNVRRDLFAEPKLSPADSTAMGQKFEVMDLRCTVTRSR